MVCLLLDGVLLAVRSVYMDRAVIEPDDDVMYRVT